jgi:pimeloyl-ACP methyl ester carboxylesterase
MQVTSGKAMISVDVTDASDDPALDLLFLHAGVTDKRSWHAVAAALSGRSRCIAFDARGFGETTYEAEPGWSPVDDAIRVLDAVGSERAVVVGSSSGGYAAVDLALARPERVSGLVLIAPAVRGAPYPDPTERETDLEEGAGSAQEAGSIDLANALEAQLWLDGPTSREGRVGGLARALFLEMNERALRAADTGPTADRAAAWPRLGEICVPALVLVGNLDVSDLRAIGRLLAAALPNATFTELIGVAHLPQLEEPEVLSDVIATFISPLRGAS